MNIELIDKDISIQNVVRYFLNKYKKTGIKIRNYWDADTCAIGITDSRGKYLFYISTFGQEENRFNVSLESPPKENSELPYEPAGTFDNIDLDKLEELLLTHLKIKNCNDQQES